MIVMLGIVALFAGAAYLGVLRGRIATLTRALAAVDDERLEMCHVRLVGRYMQSADAEVLLGWKLNEACGLELFIPDVLYEVTPKWHLRDVKGPKSKEWLGPLAH